MMVDTIACTIGELGTDAGDERAESKRAQWRKWTTTGPASTDQQRYALRARPKRESSSSPGSGSGCGSSGRQELTEETVACAQT